MAGERQRWWHRVADVVDRRRRLVAVALLAWATVVVAGSGPAPRDGTWLGIPPLGDVILVVVSALGILGLALLVVSLAASRRTTTSLPDRRPLWPSLLLLGALVLVASNLPEPDGNDGDAEAPVIVDDVAEPSRPGRRGASAGELAVLAAMAATLGAAIWWTRRRLATPGDAQAGAPVTDEQLAPLVADASRRLTLGSDPRSAVLAAYVALEDALTALGWARGRAETPTEHVSRVLAEVEVDTRAVTELAGLYEVARFSEHPITSGDTRTAAQALDRIRADLDQIRSGIDPSDAIR